MPYLYTNWFKHSYLHVWQWGKKERKRRRNEFITRLEFYFCSFTPTPLVHCGREVIFYFHNSLWTTATNRLAVKFNHWQLFPLSYNSWRSLARCITDCLHASTHYSQRWSSLLCYDQFYRYGYAPPSLLCTEAASCSKCPSCLRFCWRSFVPSRKSICIRSVATREIASHESCKDISTMLPAWLVRSCISIL